MQHNHEIGGEFWSYEKLQDISDTTPWSPLSGDVRFFLSGRTALDAVIADILLHHTCTCAYLPSYCCHTMIEPFIRHGLHVKFYPVVYEGGNLVMKVDKQEQCDITLVMDYFGFSRFASAELPSSIIIQDLTHSLLGSTVSFSGADYLFASFRKWDAVAGAAVACKRTGEFTLPHLSQCDAYIALRKKAYALKSSYISGDEINKQIFLDLFNQAETMLSSNYVGYAADKDALMVAGGLASHTKTRRKNAAMLIEGLSGVRCLSPIFSELRPDDVPLFVPVLVKNGKRNALRQFLIENCVYCPCHWPLSSFHHTSGHEIDLYNEEISLICDQRYNAVDMQRQLDLIVRFDETYA